MVRFSRLKRRTEGVGVATLNTTSRHSSGVTTAANCSGLTAIMVDLHTLAAARGHVEAITVCAHDDKAGKRYARALADALDARGFEIYADGLLS
jgi:hypothetical protein